MCGPAATARPWRLGYKARGTELRLIMEVWPVAKGGALRRIGSKTGCSLWCVPVLSAWGSNKPNTRWVVHYQAPCTITEYVQEVGPSRTRQQTRKQP